MLWMFIVGISCLLLNNGLRAVIELMQYVTVCDLVDSEIDEFIVSMQECIHRWDDSNQMRCVSVSGQIEIEFVDLSRFSSKLKNCLNHNSQLHFFTTRCYSECV